MAGSINLGSNDYTKEIFLGDKKVVEAYIGTELVFPTMKPFVLGESLLGSEDYYGWEVHLL